MARLRTSPALAVALLALVIALSGTAYALTLPRNSVGTPQLKKNAVVSAKVKNDTLTGADIKESTLKPTAGSYTASGMEFRPRDVADTLSYESGGMVYRAAGSGWFAVRLQLPHGALLTNASFHVSDNNGSAYVAVAVSRVDAVDASLVNLVYSPAAVVPQDGGVHTATLPFAASTRVDNTRYSYYAMVNPSAIGTTLMVSGVTVSWTP
ncbi:MAG TPA: hypothetical protein VFK52_06705 [Nocardioidaceae bacterium]|nr:hypothetical protein [Nocardioidaceae bacterium]